MSSFFALVTPLSGFDGNPALPGQLPVYPSLPGMPPQAGLPPFHGQLPSPPGVPPVFVPPTFPGQLPSFPGSPPAHPWLPGYGGAPGADNGLPGSGGHPWLPGHWPGQGSGTLPVPPGYISIQPLPPVPAGDGHFWALSAYGWVKVPDAYKPPPETKPEAPGAEPK